MGTEGWVKRSEGYKSDVWSSVTYETTEGGATVDILILSNAKDGMVAVYGSDLRGEKDADDWRRIRRGEVRDAGRHAEAHLWTSAEDTGQHLLFAAMTRSTGRMLLKRRSWAAA